MVILLVLESTPIHYLTHYLIITSSLLHPWRSNNEYCFSLFFFCTLIKKWRWKELEVKQQMTYHIYANRWKPQWRDVCAQDYMYVHERVCVDSSANKGSFLRHKWIQKCWPGRWHGQHYRLSLLHAVAPIALAFEDVGPWMVSVLVVTIEEADLSKLI